VAWSAGSTFLVLLAMGALLYGATARWLAEDAERQLRERAAMLTFGVGTVQVTGGGVTMSEVPLDPRASPRIVQLGPHLRSTVGQRAPVPGAPIAADPVLAPPEAFVDDVRISTDPAQAGYLVGGSLGGTIAVALPEDQAAWSGPVPAPLDASGFVEAVTGTTVINELSLLGAPMLVLSQPADDGIEPPYVVQVAVDRTAQLRTLEGLAIVLAVAGLAAVAVAAAFGWLYAGRALVPVRESLRRQRELAADASHELRTPLAVIRGNVELLRSGGVTAGGTGDEGPGPLEEIDAEVERLTELVDQLLLLARADSDALELEPRPTDLAAEAADAVESLSPIAAAARVELSLDVAPAPLMGDPLRLRQLAAILVDNAIRHTPPGGQVRVIAGTAEAGWARLVVADDGPGIRAEDLPHVFDRFWRAADAPSGGAGLGLAIARWIAEAHDGTIAVSSPAGGGARFEVRLPAE
jgi:signal transduction histidine kinase